jgi:glyoxylase-like metal-dependent hydrolase (beta-lactamase superfamily II)
VVEGTIAVNHRGPCTLHTYIAPEEGEMVCSHIIETPGHLVIIDTQLLIPCAREVRAYAQELGKPIERVVVTHTHPDHWMGLEVFADLPTSAFPETTAELAQIGEYLLDLKRKTLGDRIAGRLVLPAGDLAEGDVTLDGVRLRWEKLLDAEAPLMALAELPEEQTLVAQDLVYNGVFLVVGDKNAAGEYLFDGWLRALRDAQGLRPAAFWPWRAGLSSDPGRAPWLHHLHEAAFRSGCGRAEAAPRSHAAVSRLQGARDAGPDESVPVPPYVVAGEERQ